VIAHRKDAAGRWSFLPPPSPSLFPADVRGSRAYGASTFLAKRPKTPSVAFALVQSTYLRPGKRARRLSWDSPGGPSLVRRHPPLHRYTGRSPLPQPPRGDCFGQPDAIRFACSVRVVSHHLDGFLLPTGLRACCIPKPILGFIAFPAPWLSPRRGFVPPGGFSSLRAASRHRDRCLRAVLTTSRRCSLRESAASPSCFHDKEARSSLGFVPLQGSSECSHFLWRMFPTQPLDRSRG